MRKTILVLTTRTAFKGGGERSLYFLICSLCSDYDFFILPIEKSESPFVMENVIILPALDRTVKLWKFPYYCKRAGRITRTLDFHMIYANGQLVLPLGVYLKKKYGRQLVFCQRQLTVKNDPVYGKKCFNFKPEAIRIFNYNLTWKIVNYLACKYADAIIAISNSVKNSFLCKKKVVVIYNKNIKEPKANECIRSHGDDIFKSFIEKSRNKFVLGFIGSICELKGFRDVVNSLIVLKQKGYIEEMILCVIGRFANQKFKTNILRTISENHLSSHILFIGENFNPFPYIHHFNILLHLSKKEAFGLVILEAFSEGVPVISYNYGGPAEIVQHGKNGFTIDIGDVNKVADSITYLLKNSDVYNTMRTEAQERFQYFNSYSTFERIKKIFEAHCE